MTTTTTGPRADPPAAPNADPGELAKFSALAHRWWDPTSEFRPLHDMNPVRLAWISEAVGGLAGRRVLDVGCGGGILTEAMAREGATVTGIDLAERALAVARLHRVESGAAVDYELAAAEDYAQRHPQAFDVVTCMELLEHVPDPSSTVAACSQLLRPGGHAVFATLNRNPKSYLFAIIGAEYVLRLLPRGTHDWSRFIRPSELAGWCRDAGLATQAVAGVSYNPFTRAFSVGRDTDVNYLALARKA